MSGADDSVTIVVTRTVKRGCEEAYEEWLRGVGAAAHRYPGHMGMSTVRPTDDGRGKEREWVLVYRFDTVEHLRAWERSPERAAWIARGEELCEKDTTRVQRLTGLETWFALPSAPAIVPPPRWKMAIVSFCVAFPLIQVLNATLVPAMTPLPPLARGPVFGATMVLIMTYAAMPLATRLLARFLYPRRD